MSEQISCPGCNGEHSCTYAAKRDYVVRVNDNTTNVVTEDYAANDCIGLGEGRNHICRFCGIAW